LQKRSWGKRSATARGGMTRESKAGGSMPGWDERRGGRVDSFVKPGIESGNRRR